MSEAVNYPVMERFYTIQGEGYNTGRAAYFIRLGGCDVGCVWCDVKESWEAGKHPLLSTVQLIDEVKKTPAESIVVTGGEPAMYDLEPLTNSIHAAMLDAWIETSGAYPITGDWEWICVSPKKFKKPVAESLYKANELKVVIYNKSDFDFALENAKGVNPDCLLFIQPEFSKRDEMIPLIVDFVKAHPQWRVSLQTHKYLHIP
ncbi:MAG: 7-carboxy-7-deazaguanine synthase QueE [Bacteroidia bacterium]